MLKLAQPDQTLLSFLPPTLTFYFFLWKTVEYPSVEIIIPYYVTLMIWLVGCIGFNGPLRQYFSLYQAVSQREGERGEKG